MLAVGIVRLVGRQVPHDAEAVRGSTDRWSDEPPKQPEFEEIAEVAGISILHGAAILQQKAERAQNRPSAILIGMTHRVGPKGQVVIPKDLRDELGIEPGDEVSFWRDGDHLALRPTRHRPSLRGRFEGSTLTDDLMAQRHADRMRETRR